MPCIKNAVIVHFFGPPDREELCIIALYSICNPGASIPPTPWSKFPSPSPSFALPSSPFPSPLEVGPLIAARGSGERFSSPAGPGGARHAKRYLVNFRLKISPNSNDLQELRGEVL